MIHMKHCPHIQEGNRTTLFFKDGEPQKYCEGWMDYRGVILDVCARCPEYCHGKIAKDDRKAAPEPYLAKHNGEIVKCEECANWINGQCFRYRTRDPKRKCMCADENFTSYNRRKAKDERK